MATHAPHRSARIEARREPRTRSRQEGSRAHGRFWAIVLAGGFGRRLQGLTVSLSGESLPKQFCRLGSDRSLLQRTVDRISPLVPTERVVVVVDESMQDVAADQLRDRTGLTLLRQPRERGTGPGVLLPLLHVLSLDPEANVLLVPSDHAFEEPERFRETVRGAQRCVDYDPSRIVLLGVEPGGPATDLGWILPSLAGGPLNGIGLHPVAHFVEKPSGPLAGRLFLAGGVWNTMIAAARGTELLCLLRITIPDAVEALAGYASTPADELGHWLHARYDTLQASDFSSRVLESAPNLTLLTIPANAGWTDLGTPERLMRWLARRDLEHRAFRVRPEDAPKAR
jgi:mannose-1-phosphate guanylyltransferase